MIHTKLLRTVPAAIALTLAFGLSAQAQSANPTGPGNISPNKAGEAYPNGPTTSKPDTNNAVARTVVKTEDKVANSRPAKATKRVAKKTTKAVKNAGTKTGNAIRNTGEKIGEKFPPAPNRPSGVPQ